MKKKNPKFNWKHDKHLKYGYSSYIILLGVTFWHSILEIKIATLFYFCIKLVWMYAFYQVNLFGLQLFFEKVRNHSHTLWKRPCRKIETILTSVTKLSCYRNQVSCNFWFQRISQIPVTIIWTWLYENDNSENTFHLMCDIKKIYSKNMTQLFAIVRNLHIWNSYERQLELWR